jgi:hypothetical protein
MTYSNLYMTMYQKTSCRFLHEGLDRVSQNGGILWPAFLTPSSTD